MNLKRIGLLVTALLMASRGFAAASEAGPPATPNVIDETGTVKGNYQEVAELQANLEEFQSETGIRIMVEYNVKSPPEAEDAPGQYMRARSSRLGLIKNGILMAHFADDPDWRVWIGDDLTPRFVGKPGTAREFTESGAMHAAKEALLKSAMKSAADAYAGLHAPPPDFKNPHNPYAHLYLRLQTSALVDALKAKFRAAP